MLNSYLLTGWFNPLGFFIGESGSSEIVAMLSSMPMSISIDSATLFLALGGLGISLTTSIAA
jgi:hypothetical protein